MTRSSVLAAIAILSFTCAANAHTVGVSKSVWTSDGTGVDGVLTFAAREAPDAAAFATMISAGISVEANAERCPHVVTAFGATEGDALSIRIEALCADGPATRVVFAFLDGLPAGHTHLARAPGVSEVVLSASAKALSFARSTASSNLFVVGMRHILTGFDHLLFLFGVLLARGRTRDLIFAVTAFTVGHSISLAAAALGIASVQSATVEPAIAASIIYVGIETIFMETPPRRWPLTLLFGLVHGFGIAGALAALDLPRSQLLTGLVTFNLGVEAGQLLLIAATLPLLLWLGKQPWFARRGRSVFAGGVALLGTYWLVERLTSL